VIAESGLLVAFFIGLLIGRMITERKFKAYEIIEFKGIKKIG